MLNEKRRKLEKKVVTEKDRGSHIKYFVRFFKKEELISIKVNTEYIFP